MYGCSGANVIVCGVPFIADMYVDSHQLFQEEGKQGEDDEEGKESRITVAVQL